jgi:uncharacterized protein YbjT (DUF2867 family)
MRVILFGATGMIGQGVLYECLDDAGVDHVLAVGRGSPGKDAPKLEALVLPDLTDYSGVADRLGGYDACFFCLGVSSAGMAEADYRRVTVDIAVAAAKALLAKNPTMTFVFVSGRGADSSGMSRTMWSRVKGEAENAILSLPFKSKYVFRPAMVRPERGIRSRTAAYNAIYAVVRPLVPLIQAAFPSSVSTTSKVGRAMLNVARHGFAKPVLESEDINAAAARP